MDKYQKDGPRFNLQKNEKGSWNAEAAFKVTIQSTFLMMIYSARNWLQEHTRTLSTGESVWRWLKFGKSIGYHDWDD